MIAALTIAACTWADPGADPYTGPVPAAVESYADIPAPVRARLRERMEARQYDEIATIRRDSIEGQHSYSDLRGMHFGRGKVCQSVDRSAWTAEHAERGLVYCEGEHCLIVPTVCRNVSRVTRLVRQEPPAAPEPPAEPSQPAGQGIVFPAPPLRFDPPAAGPAPVSFEQAARPPVVAAPAPVWWQPLPVPVIQPWAGVPPGPPIPEPGTWLLMVAGLGVLALHRLRAVAMGCLLVAIWAVARRLRLWEFGE